MRNEIIWLIYVSHLYYSLFAVLFGLCHEERFTAYHRLSQVVYLYSNLHIQDDVYIDVHSVWPNGLKYNKTQRKVGKQTKKEGSLENQNIKKRILSMAMFYRCVLIALIDLVLL